MKVESIVECSPWSILQYFWPALSDNWSWKPIFGLFESGRFTQVLLYFYVVNSSIFQDSTCQHRFKSRDENPSLSGSVLTSVLKGVL